MRGEPPSSELGSPLGETGIHSQPGRAGKKKYSHFLTGIGSVAPLGSTFFLLSTDEILSSLSLSLHFFLPSHLTPGLRLTPLLYGENAPHF